MAKDYFPEGFACKDGCGLNSFDPAMRAILNAARDQFGKPLVILSGCRCIKHNAEVGGAPHSAHLQGPDNLCHAADLACTSDLDRWMLLKIFQSLGVLRLELSELHIHIDNAVHLPRPILAVKRFLG